MSGVFGVYGPGVRAGRGVLREMMARSACRGPDRQELWHEGPVGMGHCLLATTPEAVHERQPLQSPDGTCRLVSHARIDNRDDVLVRLDRRDLAHAPDSRLILEAYLQWGTACPRRLVGDYAFAVWDGRSRRLFCVRDAMGVCPFHYAFDGRQFLFASEIGPLLAAGCPDVLNDDAVFDALLGRRTDAGMTCYRAIRRLPPGHFLVVGREAAPVARAWFELSPNPSWRAGAGGLPTPSGPHRPQGRGSRPSRRREVVEAFLDVYSEAVRCRLRCQTRAGVWLSGGIDSGSIVAVAYTGAKGPSPLLPLCAVFDDLPEADERPFMQVIADRFRIGLEFVAADGFAPFGGRPHVPWADEPSVMDRAEVVCALMGRGRDLGLRAILTGFPADVFLEGNPLYVFDLIRSGRWGEAAREVARFPPAWRREALRGWVRAAYHDRIAPSLRRAGLGRVPRAPTWLSPSAAGRGPVVDPRSPFRRLSQRTECDKVTATAGLPELVWMQNAALRHGIELRHPFFDARVVAFLSSVPAQEKLAGGVPKSILRDATAGLLPDSVRLPGPDRGNFDALLDRGLCAVLGPDGGRWLHRGLLVSLGYANPAGLRDLLRSYVNGDRRGRHQIGRAVRVEQWLRMTLGAPMHLPCIPAGLESENGRACPAPGSRHLPGPFDNRRRPCERGRDLTVKGGEADDRGEA